MARKGPIKNNIPAGDTKYNKMIKNNTETLKLNACLLKFEVNSKHYEFSANLPDHFKKFMQKNSLKKIEKNYQF